MQKVVQEPVGPHLAMTGDQLSTLLPVAPPTHMVISPPGMDPMVTVADTVTPLKMVTQARTQAAAAPPRTDSHPHHPSPVPVISFRLEIFFGVGDPFRHAYSCRAGRWGFDPVILYRALIIARLYIIVSFCRIGIRAFCR